MTYKKYRNIKLETPPKARIIRNFPYQNKNSNLELVFYNDINLFGQKFETILKYFELLYINEKNKNVLLRSDNKNNTYKLNAFLKPQETRRDVKVVLVFDKSQAVKDLNFFEKLDCFLNSYTSNDNQTPLLSCNVLGQFIKEEEGNKSTIFSQSDLISFLKHNLEDFSDKPELSYIFFDGQGIQIKSYKNKEELKEVALVYKQSDKSEKHVKNYPGYVKFKETEMINFFTNTKVKTIK